MQYGNHAILAMIASALNDDAVKRYLKDDITEIETTPDRTALIVCMVDGRQFQIDVKEVE